MCKPIQPRGFASSSPACSRSAWRTVTMTSYWRGLLPATSATTMSMLDRSYRTLEQALHLLVDQHLEPLQALDRLFGRARAVHGDLRVDATGVLLDANGEGRSRRYRLMQDMLHVRQR